MLFLTAHDSAMVAMGDLLDESLDLYAYRMSAMRIKPPERQRRLIPPGYPKPASWFKVRAILDALPHHDYVWWIDADALITGNVGPYAIVNGKQTLYISSDANGVNCGVMAWRNCHESREALWRIYENYERFCGHPWWEQVALREFVDQLTVCHLEKRITNSGPDDTSADSFIYHVPGKGPDEKIRLLTDKLAETKTRYGH